jgi:GNAT superfamily N-acetyltransferase
MHIEPVSAANLSSFMQLMQAIEREVAPSDECAADRAAAGIRASLEHFDFMRSDSCWMLMATSDSTPAGYATFVRIPKADARIGFLFVDELYVLKPFRRAGVARALLQSVDQKAAELSLIGVRLLVRSENAAARNLYNDCGYTEHTTLFCEKRLSSGR